MRSPTITYSLGSVNGRPVHIRTTTYPALTAEERQARFLAGQRAFRAGPFMEVDFLDDEPDADIPVVVEA